MSAARNITNKDKEILSFGFWLAKFLFDNARRKPKIQFKSGGIVAGTIHKGEPIISKKVFGKINLIELP